MNKTENTRLLRLYKLLWEQIKDEQFTTFLMTKTSEMEIKGIITREEENLIDDDLFANRNTVLKRKDYVLKRIKELENDK